MKKVYVTTYCVPSSYGSILQAFGTIKTLNSLGYNGTIVQLKKPPTEKYPLKLKRFTPAYIKEYFKKCMVIDKLNLKQKNTCEFIKNNIPVEYYPTLDSMKEALKDGEVFISGSDQVWNPISMYPEFFLQFAPKNSKKLSYGASMGVLNIPENKKETFSRYINTFDVISVRESDCVPVISQYTEKEINVNIDPTFLVSADEWRKYQKPYPIEKPYILVYPLFWDASVNEKLKKLHETTNKNIVVLGDYKRNIYANQWIFDADPSQFLWLLDNADGVVSSSFHGAALAINHNKPTAVVINPSAPSRISSMLALLEHPEISIEDMEKDKKPDYTIANNKISIEREKSINFLKEAIENLK